jgi:hypothetical protein
MPIVTFGKRILCPFYRGKDEPSKVCFLVPVATNREITKYLQKSPNR